MTDSRALIKNHTENSRDGGHTGLGERAVKSRTPRRSKGVFFVFVCFLLLLFSTPLIAWSLSFFH
jgi:hypothetical protein